MKYTMDRAGQYGRSRAGDYLLRRSPGTQYALMQAARKGLAAAKGRVPVDTTELRNSGRVEFKGVKKTSGGEPRMVVSIVFHAPHAAAVAKRTGFLIAGLGRYRR